MMLIKHPTLRNEQRSVPDEQVGQWLAAGWLPLLDDEQRARLDELELEVDARFCPTCGATGEQPCRTSSGVAAAKPHAARPE